MAREVTRYAYNFVFQGRILHVLAVLKIDAAGSAILIISPSSFVNSHLLKFRS